MLPLAGERSLIQDTVARAAGDGFGRPLIVCNVEHRFLIAEQMREAGIAPAAILLEPVGRNTAPAAAVAALMVAEKTPTALMLLMPADHVIRDRAAFHAAVARAEAARGQRHLVTFGIAPDAPETGYGYIRAARPLAALSGCFSVARFRRKAGRGHGRQPISPRAIISGTAACSCSRPRPFWPSWRRLEPEFLAKCRAAVAAGKQDMDFFRLDAAAFAACRSISIDYAVMEHTDKAAVVPVEMGWSDIGSWDSLWNAPPRDDAGNAMQGDVLQDGTRNSYLRSEGPLVAAVGVEDLVVVATADAVLVSHKSASQDVKKIVEQLKAQGRELHISHRKVYRPWGSYEGIDTGDRLPGQAHHRQSGRQAVAADASQARRALDRGVRHGAGDLRRARSSP